jgi:hypothetical protein
MVTAYLGGQLFLMNFGQVTIIDYVQANGNEFFLKSQVNLKNLNLNK